MSAGSSCRIRISHTAFSIAFASALYLACNAFNLGTIAKWFYRNGQLDYTAFGAYLLAGHGLFLSVFLLLAHRKTIKAAAVVFTVLGISATYFIAKYGVAIDRSMIMNAIHTDSTEVRQLLSIHMIPYVIFMVVASCTIVGSLEISFRPSWKYLLDSGKAIAIAFPIAIALLLMNYNAILRAGNVSNKYIVYSLVPINLIAGGTSAVANSIRSYVVSKKRDVKIAGRVLSSENLTVVLAIGESSRRKNFSVYGYRRRNTNPEMQAIDGIHLLNGVAKRGSTLYALPEILEKNGIALPAITSRLGIRTSCFVNYTLYENCASIGETRVDHCGHGGRCYDEDVIPLVKDELSAAAPGQRLIVLHLGGGSHGPTYSDRHPPEFRRFTPLCNDADVANQCNVEELYNSYDNTILYVDYVLGKLIRTLDGAGAPYVLIYLSDHGESLLEDGRMFHGMPPGIPLPEEQAQIPLIVKSSVPVSIVPRREYGQPDVFDTVLDLLSVQAEKFDKAGSFIKRRNGSGEGSRS